MNATTGENEYGVMGGDMYTFISAFYAFYRGGVKIGIRHGSTTTGTTTVCVSPGLPVIFGSGTGSNCPAWGPTLISPVQDSTCVTGSYPGMGLGTYFSDVGNGSTYVKIPYYAPNKCSMPYNLSDKFLKDYHSPTTFLTVNGINISATGTGFGLVRAIAEDFQFSFFIGTPPIIVSQT
jgi:hypothetical protein